MYSVQCVTSCMTSIEFCHICAVYHWISHVWYNRSSRLHVALSANIGVRNSVGFFTCDEFCRICHNGDELGLIVHICDVFDRITHVWYILVGYLTCDIFGEYRCEKFGRIFHMWCSLSNISWRSKRLSNRLAEAVWTNTHNFFGRNKEIMNSPATLTFSYIKWGLPGYSLHRLVSLMYNSELSITKINPLLQTIRIDILKY